MVDHLLSVARRKVVGTPQELAAKERWVLAGDVEDEVGVLVGLCPGAALLLVVRVVLTFCGADAETRTMVVSRVVSIICMCSIETQQRTTGNDLALGCHAIEHPVQGLSLAGRLPIGQ